MLLSSEIMLRTGHYCDIGYDGDDVQLLKAADSNKDQTYFLCDTATDNLRNVMFPLGKMLKPQVREIADRYRIAASKERFNGYMLYR